MNVRTNGHKKKDPTAGLDDGAAVAALMKAFHHALVEDAFLDAADLVDVTFSLANEHVQDVLGSLAKNVRAVAESTREEIRALVGRQADEGWSIEQLQKEIRAKGEIASRSRALTIARTETGTAYNLGSVAAYRTGGVTHVEVLDGEDDPICAAANGSRWTLDEAEENPLGHPNCTRAFSPVLPD